VNFLLDNNLPPSLACALSELCVAEPGVDRVVHLADLFPPATDDLVWIPGLTRHGADWYVISLDKLRKSKGAEREALRRAGHTTYVLDPSWGTQQYWAKAVQLVQWWPRILDHTRLTKGGVHRVRWKFSPSKKFDSI
jgi:hypothetical protein